MYEWGGRGVDGFPLGEVEGTHQAFKSRPSCGFP